MPLSGSAFWAVILPVEQTNLVTNPSFERGTTGWGTLQAGTIGTTSIFQQFGAWAGSVAPTSNGTAGAVGPTFTATNGVAYTFSAYVRGQSGIPYRLSVGDSSGVNFVGSTTFTGGGTWHRYVGSWTEGAGATRRMVLTKNADADTGAIYIDGANVTAGSLSTHIDGDQEGCYWLGLPHLSQSVRSGTYRGGGSVVALEDLGLKPDDHIGIGMPPQEVTAQSYALQAGAEYQRSRSSERPFTLTFKPVFGTTTQGFHVTRRTFLNAVKPDLVSSQQSVRFWYSGGQGTVQIDAVYSAGGELGEMHGPMAEEGALRFIAHDPYWEATTQQGTALAGRVALGSANAIIKRDPLGRWGTMGAHGTSVAGTVDVLFMAPTGTLFVGGRVNTFDGTTNSRGLAMYFPSNNRFGTMGGTMTPGAIYNVMSFQYSPWGSLYIGGDFSLISGTSSRFLAQWNGAFGTLVGGTVNGRADSIRLSQTGTLFVGGTFQTANGTTSPRLAMWMPAGSMGTLVGQSAGTVDADVYELAFGLDQRLYFAGKFGSAGGTPMYCVGQWKNGTFGSMGGGLQLNGGAAPAQANALAVGADGIVTIGGYFGTVGGARGTNAAQWNGISYTVPGGGLGTGLTSSVDFLWKAAINPATSDVYAVGRFFTNANNLPFPDGMAFFNNYTWIPLDVDTPTKITSNGIVNAIAFGPDNSLYLGGEWTGTAHAASVAEIVNKGMGDAYPTLKARNVGVGTVRIFQLVNTLTGDGIYFNYALLAGEEVTLITEPGARSFTSSAMGNIYGNILPGSNISSFRLLSGTNYISFFADSGSVNASLYWTPRSDSVDGGTIF